MVSIIIPNYNKAEFITETLQSVAAQSYTDWECIIVDDGSTDNSLEVIEEIAEQDRRFSYLRKKNEGVSIARNFGIKHSRGQFILPLDSDDVIGPDYLKEAIQVLTEKKSISIVYALAEFIGIKKGAWNLPDFNKETMLHTNLVYCAALFRREVFVQSGGYADEFKSGIEDWDFWLTAIENQFQFYRIPKVHFYYRIHEMSRNKSHKESSSSKSEMYKELIKKHIDLYQANWGNFISLYRKNKRMEKKLTILESNKLLNWQFKMSNKLKSF